MGKTRFLVVGAHPDDCDIRAGGTALKIIRNGGQVMFVSATNGNAGHHDMSREDLRLRRIKETQNVSDTFGIRYFVMDNDDGYLKNTIKNRDKLIEIIRSFKPDVIATHRPYDYHTDHRNASLLVQDASFLLRVPLVCSNFKALDYDPVILYMNDSFNKPVKFEPDVVVDIDKENDDKIKMINCHESQIYEWLPWLAGTLESIPENKEQRLEYTKKWMEGRYKNMINKQLTDVYGKIYGRDNIDNINSIEAFEVCEYGRKALREELTKVFYINS